MSMFNLTKNNNIYKQYAYPILLLIRVRGYTPFAEKNVSCYRATYVSLFLARKMFYSLNKLYNVAVLKL